MKNLLVIDGARNCAYDIYELRTSTMDLHTFKRTNSTQSLGRNMPLQEYLLSVSFQANVEEEIREQVEQWIEMALSGNAAAIYKVGACLDMGDYLEVNKALAIECFKEAAVLNHSHSQYLTGVLLLGRSGSIPADPEKGVAYLKKAAEQDHLYALELLGEFHRTGEYGCKVDKALADSYEKKAKDLNDDWVIDDGDLGIILYD